MRSPLCCLPLPRHSLPDSDHDFDSASCCTLCCSVLFCAHRGAMLVSHSKGLLRDVFAVSLRNCCSSCALDKFEIHEDEHKVVVRPGPIGLHVATADDPKRGLLVTESEQKQMRSLEQNFITHVQTVFDEAPVPATVKALKSHRSWSRILFVADSAASGADGSDKSRSSKKTQ